MRRVECRSGSRGRAWTLALVRCVAAAFFLSTALRAQGGEAAAAPASSISVSAYDLPRQVGGMTVYELLQKPPFSNPSSRIELWCVWSDGGSIQRKKAADFTVAEQQALHVQRYTPGFGDRLGVADPLSVMNPRRSDDRKYRDDYVTSEDKGGVVGVEIDPPVDNMKFAAWALVVAAVVGLALGAIIGASLARRARPA